jgi:metal-responsive CopG/Arc/MetJ family transcriptional regulator
MKGPNRLRARARTFGPPLALRFPGAMLEEIDGIAARRFDQPDRSAVIRELLAEALAARRKASVRAGEPA